MFHSVRTLNFISDEINELESAGEDTSHTALQIEPWSKKKTRSTWTISNIASEVST